MGPLGRLPLVVGTAPEDVADPDSFDDQNLVLDMDITFGVSLQPPLARLDPARLQRAAQSAAESTGGGGDHVVESGCSFWVLPREDAVVRRHLAVGPEDDGLGLRRQVRLAQGSTLADHSNLCDICGRGRFHANSQRSGRPTPRAIPRSRRILSAAPKCSAMSPWRWTQSR